VTGDGYALGTLCVLDRVPRQLTPDQIDSLSVLARQTMSSLELRRRLRADRERSGEALIREASGFIASESTK
jgi:GAF domain-containing protein